MSDEINEIEYVDECPNCDTRFIGLTPDEFRNDHAPECNYALGLLVFPQ